MAIRPVRTERNDHVRPDPPQMPGDPGGSLRRICRVKGAVLVVEEYHLSESQFLCRGAQFSLARPPDDCGPGRFTIVEETATLAARGRHQIRLNTLAGILRQRSTVPQRLIVGMSEHTHQAQVHLRL